MVDLTDKRAIKKLFIKSSLFVSLFENFRRGYEDEVLGLYSNHINFENGKAEYLFLDADESEGKALRERYENEVHRTVRKTSGGRDRDLSLFNWLRIHGIITDAHYEQLVSIRKLRNELVHELDRILGDDIPGGLDELLKQLIDIRKHATKWWYLLFEHPTEVDFPFDIQKANLDEIEVIGNSDFFFDIVREIAEED